MSSIPMPGVPGLVENGIKYGKVGPALLGSAYKKYRSTDKKAAKEQSAATESRERIAAAREARGRHATGAHKAGRDYLDAAKHGQEADKLTKSAADLKSRTEERLTLKDANPFSAATRAGWKSRLSHARFGQVLAPEAKSGDSLLKKLGTQKMAGRVGKAGGWAGTALASYDAFRKIKHGADPTKTAASTASTLGVASGASWGASAALTAAGVPGAGLPAAAGIGAGMWASHAWEKSGAGRDFGAATKKAGQKLQRGDVAGAIRTEGWSGLKGTGKTVGEMGKEYFDLHRKVNEFEVKTGVKVATKVGHEVGRAKDAVTDKAGQAKDAVADKASDARQAVTHEAAKATNAVADKAGDAKDAVADKAGDVKDAIGGLF